MCSIPPRRSYKGLCDLWLQTSNRNPWVKNGHLIKFEYHLGTDVTQNVGIKRASFPGNVIPWSYTTIPNNLWENLSAYDHAWTGYKYEYIVSYSRISFLTVIYRFLQSYIVSYSRISFLTVIYRLLQSYIVSYSRISFLTVIYRFLQSYIVSYSRISVLTVIYRFLQSYIVSYSHISFLTVIYRFLQSYITLSWIRSFLCRNWITIPDMWYCCIKWLCCKHYHLSKSIIYNYYNELLIN